MMPKLPEPDDSSTEIETGAAAYWFRLETVRAIQEEAYKAGMAAERERFLALCIHRANEDGDGHPECWGWHAEDFANAIKEVK
jgi:hypothetical protein